MVVVGNVLDRLVDIGFTDGDLVLGRFLQFQYLVFHRAQDLRSDLRDRVLGQLRTGGRGKQRDPLIEIVI